MIFFSKLGDFHSKSGDREICIISKIGRLGSSVTGWYAALTHGVMCTDPVHKNALPPVMQLFSSRVGSGHGVEDQLQHPTAGRGKITPSNTSLAPYSREREDYTQ